MTIRVRTGLSLLLLALLLVALVVAIDSTVSLAQRIAGLPLWLQWTVAAILALFALAALWLGWKLLRPRRAPAATVVDRAGIDQRVRSLDELGADTLPLQAELDELDRRRVRGKLYVAVFGEVSAGKSSLIAALAADNSIVRDVVGGTTRAVEHHDARLRDGRTVILADVPGSAEVGGEHAETLAREEALRAHLVLYVCAGDLSRTQGEELRWLAAFGKPLLVVLNKTDQFSEREREALLKRLRERSRGIASAVVAVSAGGSEHFARTLADGRIEQVERSRVANIDALQHALARLACGDTDKFETAREGAVLAGLHQRATVIEHQSRERAAGDIVSRYTRRAIVGALAAVVPGSDLIIQGALATGLVRELGKLYGAAVSDIEIDAFLKKARLTLRTSASLVLAIAGNALKAFPGLGTVGGGLVQAVAYGMIFDSLGHAVAQTFADKQSLDSGEAGAALGRLLADASTARLKRIASIALKERKS